MVEQRLPLDSRRYAAYLSDLRAIVCGDPDLEDARALRAFVEAHREYFGPRTAAATLHAADDELRVVIHVTVLASSELADLHGAARERLLALGSSPPPWDVTIPRTTQRTVSFGGRVRGVVEWIPERSVHLAPDLSEPERRWVTALAVGIGECPQWSEDDVWRYAAYLVLGVEEFAFERHLSDEELAARHGVPIDAVRYRRGQPDTLAEA